MGRRSVSLHDQDRWVFNRLARDYLARPRYPDALVDRLVALAGGPGARVADLGAGTGLLALPLAGRGLSVTALEPALAMLSALEAGLGEGLTVTLVHATAETTGLPPASFDLVLIADAVQWVDPELAGREAARLLAAGGTLALLEPAFAPTPFMEGLAALLARGNPKARPRPAGAAHQLLALAAPGTPPSRETFRQDAPLDEAALEAFLRSLSYAGPALAPRALEDLVAEALQLARESGGARLQRVLTLRWATRRIPRGAASGRAPLAASAPAPRASRESRGR